MNKKWGKTLSLCTYHSNNWCDGFHTCIVKSVNGVMKDTVYWYNLQVSLSHVTDTAIHTSEPIPAQVSAPSALCICLEEHGGP